MEIHILNFERFIKLIILKVAKLLDDKRLGWGLDEKMEKYDFIKK